MKNLRPISLLDTIKRLVGRIITDRLSKAAEANGVYTDLQFGFRHHHSTKMAIARLHASIQEARARRSRLVVAYHVLHHSALAYPAHHDRSRLLGARHPAYQEPLRRHCLSGTLAYRHIGLD